MNESLKSSAIGVQGGMFCSEGYQCRPRGNSQDVWQDLMCSLEAVSDGPPGVSVSLSRQTTAHCQTLALFLSGMSCQGFFAPFSFPLISHKSRWYYSSSTLHHGAGGAEVWMREENVGVQLRIRLCVQRLQSNLHKD